MKSYIQTDQVPELTPGIRASRSVQSVSRADLVQAGFPPEFVAQLTDEQMERIAAKMGDYYNDQGYWEHVTDATENRTGLTGEMGEENYNL